MTGYRDSVPGRGTVFLYSTRPTHPSGQWDLGALTLGVELTICLHLVARLRNAWCYMYFISPIPLEGMMLD